MAQSKWREFSHENPLNMVMFRSYVNVYQRVNMTWRSSRESLWKVWSIQPPTSHRDPWWDTADQVGLNIPEHRHGLRAPTSVHYPCTKPCCDMEVSWNSGYPPKASKFSIGIFHEININKPSIDLLGYPKKTIWKPPSHVTSWRQRYVCFGTAPCPAAWESESANAPGSVVLHHAMRMYFWWRNCGDVLIILSCHVNVYYESMVLQ